MKTLFFLPLAIIVSALSFPAMLFGPEAKPQWPSREALERGMGPDDWYRKPFHWLKNITTECVRADAEWWSKFLCFSAVAPVATGCAFMVAL
jgi:hypothetical protein